jgi:hypothetical protein
MTFIFGAVLFLLGGFFGMLVMAFAQSLPRQIQEQQDALVAQLRLVVEDE